MGTQDGRADQTSIELEQELASLVQSTADIWSFLQDGSLNGVWFLDLTAPGNDWISPEFLELVGLQDEKAPRDWRSLPTAISVAQAAFDAHIQDPAKRIEFIARFEHSKGAPVWTRCRGLAIRGDDGTATRMLCAFNDLTQHIQSEQSLLAANQRARTVLDTATNGIVGLSTDREVLIANPAARHMLGGINAPTPFPWPENIRFLEAVHLRPLDSSADPVFRTLSGQALSGETHLMTRANSPDARYIRFSSALLDENDSSVRAVVVLDDVTVQELNRQKIERSSRLDALGQLTGGIAHDFNNLLSTIQYSIQLSMEESDPEQNEVYLKTALASVNRGAELAKHLLAFGRRQPGQARSKKLSAVFQDLYLLVRPTIEEAIHIEVDLTRAADQWVFCDQGQLDNAMLNLVINSRDAILRSGIGDKITISARGLSEVASDSELFRKDLHMALPGTNGTNGDGEDPEEPEEPTRNRAHRYVEISVTDNGPGMGMEVKRRAVDPFFTTKDTNSGSGLGLSMVYGFVQQSGGELRIYSEEGYGTTVRLTMPRGTPEGMREQPVNRVPAPTGAGQRILIVEDEEENLLDMMGSLIKSLGYRVTTARSGTEALQIVDKGGQFELVITDIVMPGGVGGFDLARKLRQRSSSQPILYMSGYTGFNSEEMGDVTAPMLPKPSSPMELAEAIRAVLGDTVPQHPH